jgi:hypothetical protein
MQFTPQEMKWIERLRKEERQWPRLRWFTLGAGIFSILCYGFILIVVFYFPGFPESASDVTDLVFWLVFFAVEWPKCLIGFLIGGWIIVWTILNWRGNANRILLLRLLDASQKIPDIQKPGDLHD